MHRTIASLLRRVFVTALVILSLPVCSAHAQSAPDTSGRALERKPALHVYLDCGACEMDFFVKELPYVDFVRDAADADVHVLVTDQPTGGGGNEYTLRYLGKRAFAGVDDELRFASRSIDTDFEIRKNAARVLALGLARYLAHTSYADELSVAFAKSDTPVQPEDPWDFWVFNLAGSSYLNGEQTSTYQSSNGSLSINRVTEQWKYRSSVSLNYQENTFEIDDSTSITSISRNQQADALLVRALNAHFSAGASAVLSTSTYSNIALSAKVMPAIEYDVFPYEEATWRQLRVLYSIGVKDVRYTDTTIYDKLHSTLFLHSLSLTYETKQPWGNASGSLSASSYLHDAGKYSVGISGSFTVRVFKGFGIDCYGGYSAVHDQLSIAKGDLSTDEILLQRSQRETQFSYYVSLGISYTFGSIFSNIVNPRFGN
jgi:hypothetical protein